MSSNANPNKKKFNTKTLVLAALFAAMALVLKPFEFYVLPVVRFGFVAVPILLAGIMIGPLWGAGVGFVADVLGYMMFDKSGQGIIPILVVSSILMGVIPGLIFLIKDKTGAKAIKYSSFNILLYLLIIAATAGLLFSQGAMKFENNTLLILNSAGSTWNPVSWWQIAIVVAAFLLYAVSVTVMAQKNETSETKLVTAKILFAITLAEIIADVFVSGLGLADLYNWPIMIMFAVRFLKALIVIPIYTTLAALIYNALSRYKVRLK